MTLSRKAGSRLRDRAPKPLPRERRYSPADIEGALDRLMSNHETAQPITIAIMLESSNVVLRVTNPESVQVMLRAELQRRRQQREAQA